MIGFDMLLKRLSVKPLYAEIPAYHSDHRAWLRIQRPLFSNDPEFRPMKEWKFTIGVIEFPVEYVRGYWEEQMDVTSSEATEYIVTHIDTEWAFEWVLGRWIDNADLFTDKRNSQCPY
jgi:hypothetical protein